MRSRSGAASQPASGRMRSPSVTRSRPARDARSARPATSSIRSTAPSATTRRPPSSVRNSKAWSARRRGLGGRVFGRVASSASSKARIARIRRCPTGRAAATGGHRRRAWCRHRGRPPSSRARRASPPVPHGRGPRRPRARRCRRRRACRTIRFWSAVASGGGDAEQLAEQHDAACGGRGWWRSRPRRPARAAPRRCARERSRRSPSAGWRRPGRRRRRSSAGMMVSVSGTRRVSVDALRPAR